MYKKPKTKLKLALTPPDTPTGANTTPTGAKTRPATSFDSFSGSPQPPQPPQPPTLQSPRTLRFSAARSPNISPSNEVKFRAAINIIKTFICNTVVNVNDEAIANAVMKMAKRVKSHENADDLRRIVADIPIEEFKKFTTPELTDAQVVQIKNVMVRMGGGSKKNRRTGKKAKGKSRNRKTAHRK